MLNNLILMLQVSANYIDTRYVDNILVQRQSCWQNPRYVDRFVAFWKCDIIDAAAYTVFIIKLRFMNEISNL